MGDFAFGFRPFLPNAKPFCPLRPYLIGSQNRPTLIFGFGVIALPICQTKLVVPVTSDKHFPALALPPSSAPLVPLPPHGLFPLSG